jgi:hypothetical protein
MQIRSARNGLIVTIVVTAALAAVTVAVVLPGDAAAAPGGDESATSPDTVVAHVPQNTPGTWAPEEMDQAEPMPLLPPDHPGGPAGSGTPAAGQACAGNPRPPQPVNGNPATRPRHLRALHSASGMIAIWPPFRVVTRVRWPRSGPRCSMLGLSPSGMSLALLHILDM